MISNTGAAGGISPNEVRLNLDPGDRPIIRGGARAADGGESGDLESGWRSLLLQLGLWRNADPEEWKGSGDPQNAEVDSSPDLATSTPLARPCYRVLGEAMREQAAPQSRSGLPDSSETASQIAAGPPELSKGSVKYIGTLFRGLMKAESKGERRQMRKLEQSSKDLQLAADARSTGMIEPSQPLSVSDELQLAALPSTQVNSKLTGEHPHQFSLAKNADCPEQIRVELPRQEELQQVSDSTVSPAELQAADKSHAASQGDIPARDSDSQAAASVIVSARTADDKVSVFVLFVFGLFDLHARSMASPSALHMSSAPSFPVVRAHGRTFSTQQRYASTGSALSADTPAPSLSQRFVPVAFSDAARHFQQSTDANRTEMQDELSRLSDQSSNSPQQQWIHSGPRFAEAGFQDPSLGWVSVRAERDVTGMHAVLVPPSHDAGRILSAHLSGLNAHLADYQIQISPVTMSARSEGLIDSGVGSGSQRDTAADREHGNGDPAPGREGRRAAGVSLSRSIRSLYDRNRYESTSLRIGINSLNGLHVSLVA